MLSSRDANKRGCEGDEEGDVQHADLVSELCVSRCQKKSKVQVFVLG